MKVSELNLKAKALLEAHLSDILLEGEISNITRHGSGHWYFELKDERASIACVMFKGANARVSFIPKTGDVVQMSGTVGIYEANGRYQFIAKTMVNSGFGDLEAKFLALKEKLEKEGLFDPAHKKEIPALPRKIGLISSFTSAALQDMQKLIAQKEYFLAKFFVLNALTQGLDAPQSLIKALAKADKMGLDLIIIARGGGSREDLFCFNDENLARAIYAAQTPIISAIGHEIDYVISDFVADLRAPTPSAAIDLALPSKNDLAQSLDLLDDKLKTLMQNKLESLFYELCSTQKLFRAQSLGHLITQKFELLGNLKREFKAQIDAKFTQNELKFKQIEHALNQHRGFFERSKNLVSISKNGQITPLNALKSGDEVLLSGVDARKEARIL